MATVAAYPLVYLPIVPITLALKNLDKTKLSNREILAFTPMFGMISGALYSPVPYCVKTLETGVVQRFMRYPNWKAGTNAFIAYEWPKISRGFPEFRYRLILKSGVMGLGLATCEILYRTLSKRGLGRER